MSARTKTLLRPIQPARRRTGLLKMVADRLALYKERRNLADLPDYMLDDIGVSRTEAEEEARKEIWSAPSHWQR